MLNTTGTVYCPVDFEVIDVEATVAVALKAGEHPPLVVVHDTGVGAAVGIAFDDAFSRTREAFLVRLYDTFGARTLDAATIGGASFRDLRAQFQEANPHFPVSLGLGQTWARGFDAEPVRERISSLLGLIQREHLIGELRGASTVFVVPADLAHEARSWGEIAARARSVDRADILSLDAAGERLRRMNDPLDRAASGFLSGMLRANVAEDAFLTGLVLKERLGRAAERRRFARGQKLIESGQPVDRWAALAVEQLTRAGIDLTVEPPAATVVPTSEGVAVVADTVFWRASVWWWIAGGAVVVTGVLVAFFAWSVARRQTGALAVVSDERTQGRPGESLIPHLAREFRDRVIRALFTQRSVLLANEQAASRRVQEMEERLARLQPAIAERIRGYEQRIEALEKEIAERDVETRDLIRAKLVLARQELEAEITRHRIDWN